MTPLLRPVWCRAIAGSRSSTTTDSSGRRRCSSRATARPMIPPPTTMTSQRSGTSVTPAARRTLVRPADERERRPQEDAQVEHRRPVLDVPDVELDPLCPGQGGTAVDLRPPRDSGLHLEAAPLPRRVLLHLVAKRRPRPDDAHLAAQDVPELGQL